MNAETAGSPEIPSAPIVAAGAGRMGRGLAIAFALAGHRVDLLDLKAREAGGHAALRATALSDLEETLAGLVATGLIDAGRVPLLLSRIAIHERAAAADLLAGTGLVFEGVPETREAKREAFALLSDLAPADAIIASTTSTMLSTELQAMVANPERFLNAHWLNPAYLIPLVELSPGPETDPAVTARLKALLEGMGKVPVVCAASPGFIVPRLQALVMNEAARMHEEGVASAEDIDKATRAGFGLRFAILGLLEFIDFGGGDILYHASRYMVDATGEERFASPASIARNMAEGRIGLSTGKGYLDYDNLDIPAYRRERLARFVALLGHLDLLPRID